MASYEMRVTYVKVEASVVFPIPGSPTGTRNLMPFPISYSIIIIIDTIKV